MPKLDACCLLFRNTTLCECTLDEAKLRTDPFSRSKSMYLQVASGKWGKAAGWAELRVLLFVYQSHQCKVALTRFRNARASAD